MSHWSLPFGLFLLLSALVGVPFAQAAAPPLVTLGEDPLDDARHDIAPSAGVGALVSTSRTDIIAVHMGANETHLVANLTIGTEPAGTGGYMYRVSFVVDETRYFSCWNVQWIGGEVDEENVLGCSRFNGDEDGEQVGPGTTSEGVLVGSAEYNGTDAAYVQWPIDIAAVGGTLGIVTNVTADTWFRGVAICCAGSTTSSRYLWNPSDTAPEEGDWTFDPASAGGGAPLGVIVDAEVDQLTIRPGQYVTYDLNVGLNGTVPDENVSLALAAQGLEEWNWRIEPDVLTMNATNAEASAVLNITIARDRPSGTTTFNVTACTDAGTCGNATLSFTIEGVAADPPPEATSVPNATTEAAVNATTGEEAGLPGPAPLAVVAAGVYLIARRRARCA